MSLKEQLKINSYTTLILYAGLLKTAMDFF